MTQNSNPTKSGKISTKKIKITLAISTIFLGITTIFLLITIEKTNVSAQTATVGQTIDTTEGALTLPCNLNDTIFEFEPITIDSPKDFFYSTYKNPKKIHSSLSKCDGTGLTVQDTRYEGGFVLQINATDYTSTTNPEDKIPVTNLAFLTEQSTTSYNEDTSKESEFIGTNDTLLTNSQEDEVEIKYTLPFDFTFYGETYTDVYLCDNGIIHFNDNDNDPIYDTNQDCSPSKNDLFTGENSVPRIIPYYKDINLNFGLDPTFGIYAEEIDENTIKFRWKGGPNYNPSQKIEFEVILKNSEKDDFITFNYPDSTRLTDKEDPFIDRIYEGGPIIGVTKGGEQTTPKSTTYTESYLSKLSEGINLINKQAIFRPGYDFNEVKKPGTPSAIAPYNGNPESEQDYEYFLDSNSNGESNTYDLINGHVKTENEFTPGRIGLYTIYPSFRLKIPTLSTPNGTYTNEITFTITDSTGP